MADTYESQLKFIARRAQEVGLDRAELNKVYSAKHSELLVEFPERSDAWCVLKDVPVYLAHSLWALGIEQDIYRKLVLTCIAGVYHASSTTSGRSSVSYNFEFLVYEIECLQAERLNSP
jgi:hypothetical protein